MELLDHPVIRSRYFFPRRQAVADPVLVEVPGATLACHVRPGDPGALTIVHFHGNGEVIADYLWHSIWPHPLVFDYGRYRPVALSDVAPSLGLLVVLGIATLVAYWRRPALGFLGMWFFIVLSPSSSIVA